MTATEARREKQRERLIEAAERLIGESGLAGLKARDLASEVGCSVGAIYNLVKDIDELILLVGSRTLRRLDIVLTDAGQCLTGPGDAIDALVAIAIAYCGFARDNERLWRMLFEHRMAEEAAFPDWAVTERMSLFRHIVAPLAMLLPETSEPGRNLLVRTLFSAVHGVVAIGLEEKLVAVPRQQLDQQIEMLIRLVGRGLSPRSCPDSGP